MDEEMKETIYEFDESVSFEDVEKDLIKLYNKLFEHKRNDIYYEPYKAVIVIMRDKCSMKACENYGKLPHQHSVINLIRYMRNNSHSMTIDDISSPFSYIEETKLLREEVVEIRFSAGKNELLVEVDIPQNVTAFQLKTIHHAISSCRELHKEHIFPKLFVIVKIPKGKAYFENFNEEDYIEFDTFINNELAKLGNNTK